MSIDGLSVIICLIWCDSNCIEFVMTICFDYGMNVVSKQYFLMMCLFNVLG